ncbi:MAG: hypothetical protein JW822_07610 [Spirochaetales bacterium]|nr:hypothetical protein [Spirochaetales bacterium]
MEKIDFLVKGMPVAILNMFRGFCTLEGKTESQGIIDVMINYIDKNTGGSNENLKKIVEEYRAGQKK